jgi:hypothetical protein
VGELCETGEANCHAMSDTIVFGIKEDLDSAGAYQCEVLTTISSADGQPIAGAAGHVMLSFPGGGKILTSCGHWVELVKLDVSEEAMLRVAQGYGGEFYSEMQEDMVSRACTQHKVTVLLHPRPSAVFSRLFFLPCLCAGAVREPGECWGWGGEARADASVEPPDGPAVTRVQDECEACESKCVVVCLHA